MSPLSSIVVSLLAWGTVVAWQSGAATKLGVLTFDSSPEVKSTPAPSPAPVPQIAPTSSHFVLDARAILEQAHDQAKRCEWLDVEFRQHKNYGDLRWKCEGTLKCGPKSCCRLDVTTHILSKTRNVDRWLVVSDGQTVARITSPESEKPKIESWKLPSDPAEQSAKLSQLGTGGPASVLSRLYGYRAEWTAAAGSLADRPALILSATVPESKEGPHVRIILDAGTLALLRAEWWTAPPETATQPAFDVEFANAVVNRPLSFEECTRVFSYRPGE